MPYTGSMPSSSPPSLIAFSQPKGWHFVLISFLLGFVATANGIMFPWQLLALAVFFTLPAHLLIHTTKFLFLPKKEFQKSLPLKTRRQVVAGLGISTAGALALAFFLPTLSAISLLVFLAAALGTAPLAKHDESPLIEPLLKAAYTILPALVGAWLNTPATVVWGLVVGAVLWLFANKQSLLLTEPPASGDDPTPFKELLVPTATCLLLYILAVTVSFTIVGSIGITLGILYCGLVIAAAAQPELRPGIRVLLPIITTLALCILLGGTMLLHA